MFYLVKVRFMPGGSLCPEEFFRRINATWSMMENDNESIRARSGQNNSNKEEMTGLCIAEFDSIEQLAMDLSVMPGAGIAEISIESLAVAGEPALPVSD